MFKTNFQYIYRNISLLQEQEDVRINLYDEGFRLCVFQPVDMVNSYVYIDVRFFTHS